MARPRRTGPTWRCYRGPHHQLAPVDAGEPGACAHLAAPDDHLNRKVRHRDSRLMRHSIPMRSSADIGDYDGPDLFGATGGRCRWTPAAAGTAYVVAVHVATSPSLAPIGISLSAETRSRRCSPTCLRRRSGIQASSVDAQRRAPQIQPPRPRCCAQPGGGGRVLRRHETSHGAASTRDAGHKCRLTGNRARLLKRPTGIRCPPAFSTTCASAAACPRNRQSATISGRRR